MLKFENIAKIGDVIRAYDFAPCAGRDDAFVEGIMESSEWICNNGVWSQVQIDQAREHIKKVPSARLEEEKLKLFERFLSKIK